MGVGPAGGRVPPPRRGLSPAVRARAPPGQRLGWGLGHKFPSSVIPYSALLLLFSFRPPIHLFSVHRGMHVVQKQTWPHFLEGRFLQVWSRAQQNSLEKLMCPPPKRKVRGAEPCSLGGNQPSR